MNTVTMSKKEYESMIHRQQKLEKEMSVVKSLLRQEIGEEQIKPSVLKRWERISREMDRGKGYFFSSPKEAVNWLKKL